MEPETTIYSVDTLHTDYALMLSYWAMMDDATSSQTNIHEKGTDYLPKLDEMTDAQYEAYVKRACFPMYTKHSLSTFVGMVMRKDPLLTNVANEYKDNLDGSGLSLNSYLKKLVKKFLLHGRVASFVDYGDRPKVLMYDAYSIINWKTDVIDDVEQLTLVVLRETVQEEIDEFVSTDKYRYRVLSLKDKVYKQRIFSHDGLLIEETVPTANYKPLNFIPIIIHGGVDVQYPPLLTIAEQNFSYYMLDADYKHGLHFIALPTPYVTGVDPDDENAPKSVGPSKLWYLPLEAKAGMLEFTGAGIQSISKALQEVYDTIVVLSSRILAPPTSQNETATAANIRNAGETASLAEMIGTMSSEMSVVLGYMENWGNVTPDVKIEINTDFIPITLSGADVASYVSSHLKGGMSFHTLFEVLKKGEIQEGDRKIKDEIKDIAKEQKERATNELELERKKEEQINSNALRQQSTNSTSEGVNNGTKFNEN